MPDRLALPWYMAMSARCKSVATLSPCSGASEIPAVAVMARVIPSMFIGLEIAASRSRTIPRASSGPMMSGTTSTNSSPPRRATVARPLLARTRVSATSHRSRSPVPWPRVSLTSLKRSRSNNATAALPVSAQRRGRPVEEQCPVGEPGQQVVSRLVPLALGFETKLLDELGPFHGRAGVGGQASKSLQVVIVEGGEALVAVEGDEGAEGALAACERHDHGAPELAEERVDVRVALVVADRRRARRLAC